MKFWNELKMQPQKNLRGGIGTVYCSNDFRIGNIVMSCMRLAPGVSIGKHLHEDNEEAYIVLEGEAATINGEKRKMDICRVGDKHDCKNESRNDIVILSIKMFL